MTRTVTTTQPAEQDAFEQLVATSAAIEAEWTRGVRRVEELQRQAEQVRDEVRRRTAELEDQQARAILAVLGTRTVEELAGMLGTGVDEALRVVRDAEARVAQVPLQRTD
jgi:predicted transcriptional regulator